MKLKWFSLDTTAKGEVKFEVENPTREKFSPVDELDNALVDCTLKVVVRSWTLADIVPEIAISFESSGILRAGYHLQKVPSSGASKCSGTVLEGSMFKTLSEVLVIAAYTLLIKVYNSIALSSALFERLKLVELTWDLFCLHFFLLKLHCHYNLSYE